MTDLEMTKLCAEAMGFKTEIASDTLLVWGAGDRSWNPLHDDGHALALEKKERLGIDPFGPNEENCFVVWYPGRLPENFCSKNTDLNRAIVECVAKMQAAKVTRTQ